MFQYHYQEKVPIGVDLRSHIVHLMRWWPHGLKHFHICDVHISTISVKAKFAGMTDYAQSNNIKGQSHSLLPSTVWVKKNPLLKRPDIFSFFQKWLRIFNRFLHTDYTFRTMYTRSHIQLSPTLTKLCHIKRYYPVHIIGLCSNFHHRPKRMRSDVCVNRW